MCVAAPAGAAVEQLGQVQFQFVQDLAFDMAQFLVSTVGRADGLDGVLMLDECQIPLQECEKLDHSLALALRHLHLPTGWSLLGAHLGKDTGKHGSLYGGVTRGTGQCLPFHTGQHRWTVRG